MTVTDSYMPFCGVTIKSIIENNQDIKLHFFIICPDLSIENKDKLGGVISCTSDNNVQVTFLQLTPEHESLIQTAGKQLRSSHNTTFLLRLLCEKIVPDNINTILYMDVDVIVSSELKELEQFTFDNEIGAAVVKDVIRDSDYTRLNIDPKEHSYFNAGIMLINLTFWRKYSIGLKCLNMICNNPEISYMPDQDALNIVLKGKVTYLHPKYNCLMLFFMRDEFLKYRVQPNEFKRVKEAAANPSIIHYVFLNKPWFKGDYLPKKDVWHKYLKMTPWADYRQKWRGGNKGLLRHYSKQFLENVCPFFGFEVKPNLFIKKRYKHIQFIFLAIYYGFAQWLPNFDNRFFGKLSNKLRTICVRHIFDYVGESVNIGRRVKFGKGENVRLGNRSNLGANCIVPSNINIGDNVMMGPNCFFFGSFSHKTSDVTRPMVEQGLEIIPGNTLINDDVWIGRECMFMPNIEIATHSIVGARSVVTKNIPSGVIFAGNPGQIRKRRF